VPKHIADGLQARDLRGFGSSLRCRRGAPPGGPSGAVPSASSEAGSRAYRHQRAYPDLLASGLSPRTVFHTHAVLHRALKQARRWGLMATAPTELVAPPRLAQQEVLALSAWQQRDVLARTHQ